MGQLAGADVEALLRTAEGMLDAADYLEVVDLRTADGLSSVGWTGADGDRQRAAWDEQHAVTLHLTAQLLRTGAVHLVTEAEDQEATSGAGTAAATDGAGTTGTTGTTGTGSAAGTTASTGTGLTTARLRDRLASWTHDGLELSGQVVEGLAPVTTSVSVAELAAQRSGAAEGLVRSGAAARFLDPTIGPATAAGLRTLGGVGVAVSAHDYYHGVRDGDLYREVDGGVSTVLGAAALTGNPMAVGAAASWTFGTAVGETFTQATAGTDFDRRFQDRMEPVFDILGPVGMVVVPGALIVSGVETGAAAAADAYESARDYATDAWRSLTGADSGTGSGTSTADVEDVEDDGHGGTGGVRGR